MPTSRFLFIASMDVDAAHDAVFNEVYDREHIPNLLRVPGVNGVVRYQSRPFDVSLGGEVRTVQAASPRYHAVYEVESPDVLVSGSWAAAVERGRWPADVRPFTANRRHVLLERT